MKSRYDLFLFDADDTLFDFKSCERDAFLKTLKHFGDFADSENIYQTYTEESRKLWCDLEKGLITKDFLRGERFRRTFTKHSVAASEVEAGHLYLETLPQSCKLIDHAREICQDLSQKGTVAIITNGYKLVQTKRLRVSTLESFISFMVVSDECGFVKPDVRFFEHASKLHANFDKSRTLVIGDRMEADIKGANNFGVDSCWFNPHGLRSDIAHPTYEIQHLSQLREIIG